MCDSPNSPPLPQTNPQGKSVQDAFGIAALDASGSTGSPALIPVAVVRLNAPKLVRNEVVQIWQNGIANLADFLIVDEENEEEEEEEEDDQRKEWRKIVFQVQLFAT